MTKFIFRATTVVALAAVIGFVASCKKDSPTSAPALTTEQAENLRLMGYDPEKAVLDQNGDIIIDDVFFDPASLSNMVETARKAADANSGLDDRQRSIASYLAIPYAQTGQLTYFIGPGFSETEQNAIVEGVTRWENASNNLHFVRVMDGNLPYLIKIVVDDALVDAYGLAQFPDGTRPGTIIRLARRAILENCPVNDNICLRNVVMHEMGHILGLKHNDENTSGGFWFLGSPGPVVVDPGSIINSAEGTGGLPGLAQLSTPNDNDFKVISAMYPASGITVPITGVLAEWVDEDRYNFRLKYSQSGLNRSYTAYVQILQDGVVKKTKFVDIGIKSGGEIGFGVITLHPGLCQVKIFGINYRGDFTQSAYSTNTIVLE